MKENFAIITDAGGDFTREIIQKYGIEETPLSKVVARLHGEHVHEARRNLDDHRRRKDAPFRL